MGTPTRFLGWYQPWIGHPLFSYRPFHDEKVIGHAPGAGTGEPQQRLRVEETIHQIWGPFWKGTGVFWRAGRGPGWTRDTAARGSQQVMPGIHSPGDEISHQFENVGPDFVARRAGAAVASLHRWRGMVEKGEAPTFFRHRIEIRLDENLDGLFAGINLDTKGRVAKVDLVPSPVLSSNDGGGIISRFQGSAVTSLTPSNSGVERLARVTSFLQWKGRNNWQFAVPGRHPGLIIPLRASEGSTLPACRVHARQAASRHWASGVRSNASRPLTEITHRYRSRVWAMSSVERIDHGIYTAEERFARWHQ
jgi:hypothetical protein